MKLVFHDLGIERKLTSIPSVQYNSDGKPTSASFRLDEQLILEESQKLTGVFDMMSDDDMPLNSFVVEDFLRYEIYNYDDPARCSLYFTDDPIPEPMPEPEPPTPEELLAQAKSGRAERIMSERDRLVVEGVDVTTEYGDEHFTLNEHDQILLLGIYGMVQGGATSYPYHSIDGAARRSNICTVYSDADIAKIAVATFGHITFHESYANMLIQWLDRETDLDTVYQIEYGATLPEDLMAYLAMLLQSSGIDPKIIPGYVDPNAVPETPADPAPSVEPEATV